MAHVAPNAHESGLSLQASCQQKGWLQAMVQGNTRLAYIEEDSKDDSDDSLQHK